MPTLKLAAALATLAAAVTAVRVADEADADCTMGDAEFSMNTSAISATNFHDTRYSSWSSVANTITGFGPNRIKESNYLYKEIVIPSDPEACTTVADLTNKIALVIRGGTCTWLQKATNVEAANGVGVVFYESEETSVPEDMRINVRFVADVASYTGADSDSEDQTGLSIAALRVSNADGVAISNTVGIGPATVRFDCPTVAPLNYTNKTAVANAWIETQNSGIMDSLSTQFFTLDNCPHTAVSDKTCVVATAGCYEGHYCPYGNFPVDVVSPELYDHFKCVVNETDPYDCCHINATTGFTECRCTPGFYCPHNTSQPQYCFPGFYCPTPHEIYACPSGHYCPAATIEPIECTNLETCNAGAEQPERILLLFVFVVGLLVVLLLFKLMGHFVETTNARADTELSGYHEDREHALTVLEAHAAMDHIPPEYVRRRTHGVKQSHEHVKKITKAEHGSAGHIDPAITANGDANAHADSPHKAEFEIEFSDLGLTLPNGTAIMEGVTGRFTPGRACAVMGPSGAGKTMLISLITGKYQKTHGEIKVNDHPVSGLKAWEKEIGFVPQEDVMHRDLTVRQNIEFSAKLRLPSQWTAAEIHNHVDWIIDTLELFHVQHFIIGDETHRGVSGSQRKRVNIGIELAAMPSVLFLDEPTSGLDSTMATEVCTLLRRLAEEHRLTVIAVVHSPSPVAFEQFHDLLLLQKGGRTGYFGEREHAVALMTDIFKYADRMDNESPADYLLDVVSLRVHRTPGDDEIKLADVHEHITLADLYLSWRTHTQAHGDTVPAVMPAINGVNAHRMHKRRLKRVGAGLTHMEHAIAHAAHDEWAKIKHWCHTIIVDAKAWVLGTFHMDTKHGQEQIEKDTVPRSTAGLATQFWLCTQRAFRQNFRNFTDWFMGQLLHLGLGLGLAIPLSSLRFVGPYPRIICYYVSSPVMISKCELPEVDIFGTGATTLSMAICFAGVATSVYTFGGEKAIYWRECQAGLSTVAYFMGKMLVDVLRLVIAAASFFVGFLMMYTTQGSYADLFTVILGYYTFGWALGYMLSVVFPVESAPMTGVAASVIWCILFGGVTPSLREVNDAAGTYNNLKFLWDLSAPRWFNEAYYINEVSYYGKNPLNESAPYVNLTTAYLSHDYDKDNFNTGIGYGYLLAVGWAVLSLIVMLITNADKKK